MLEQLKEIMLGYVEVDPETITEDSRLAEDLGLTSFSLMCIMGEVESELGITIDETQLVDIYTVRDVLNYLETVQE